jgi:hypothetical protein
MDPPSKMFTASTLMETPEQVWPPSNSNTTHELEPFEVLCHERSKPSISNGCF